MNNSELLKEAVNIMKNSYSPYSGFRVGAAVLTCGGKVFTGVNIENSSYGATICAERTAIFKAISEGEKKINAIAISGDGNDYIFPCGICRQVLAEFADEDITVICGKRNGDYIIYTLDELLPKRFKLD